MTTITLDRRELAKTLAIGSTVVARSDIDVLGNVLMRFQRGQAGMVFTDLDIWASREIPAVSDMITATTLPAGMLTRAAAEMEGDDLTIKLADGMATLSAGRSRLRLRTLPADQFPEPQGDFGRDVAIFEAKAFADGLEAVSYAAQRGPGKLVEGVHLNAEGGHAIDLAAFDGKRIGIMSFKQVGGELAPINLPIKAARTLQQLCREYSDSQVELRTTERLAEFRVGHWVLRTKLIEGVFAPYERIAEEFPPNFATIDRSEMERALRRLALVTDKNTLAVLLLMEPGRLKMSLANAKSGDGYEEVLTDYDGAELRVGFNLGFLRDAVTHLTSESVHFGIDGQNRAFLRSATDPDRSSLHSLANMAIKETVDGDL